MAEEGEIKRKHRRKKTAAEIKAEIEVLRAQLVVQERAERERIGEKIQAWTGLQTWSEIKSFLDGGAATRAAGES